MFIINNFIFEHIKKISKSVRIILHSNESKLLTLHRTIFKSNISHAIIKNCYFLKL